MLAHHHQQQVHQQQVLDNASLLRPRRCPSKPFALGLVLVLLLSLVLAGLPVQLGATNCLQQNGGNVIVKESNRNDTVFSTNNYTVNSHNPPATATAAVMPYHICAANALQHVCAVATTNHTEQRNTCLANPRAYFVQLGIQHEPTSMELHARQLMSQVSALSIGAGGKGGNLCNQATVKKQTMCTDRRQLDLFLVSSWASLLKGKMDQSNNNNNNNNSNNHTIHSKSAVKVIFAEHVLEHFTPQQVAQVAALAFSVLEPGGVFRVAVPDGYKPSPSYQEYIRAGDTPSGKGQNHMIAWTFDTLGSLLQHYGFLVQPQEYFNATGHFFTAPHAYDYDGTYGMVRRSFRHDSRNQQPYHDPAGVLNVTDLRPNEPLFTSLWIDAVKPRDCLETVV